MNDFPASKTLEPRSEKPLKGGIDCEECKGGLADFIGEVLEQASIPEDSPIRLHLESCPPCSQTYIHLMDLMTAPQVKALQEALLDSSRSPDNLGGLLRLWQMQLAACNRLEDLNGTAVGLSIIGMIRRQLEDEEEAELVHELALRTAKESRDLLSRIISCTDLGFILRKGRIPEALRNFQDAHKYTVQLMNKESESRALILWGDLLQKQERQEEALKKYEDAKGKASAANYSLGVKIAQKRIALGRLRAVISILSAILGEISRPVRMLRQVLSEIEMPGAHPLVLAPVPATTRNQQWLEVAGLLAAPAGEKALVLNTIQEVPIEWVRGPVVDQDGVVTLAIRLDPQVLPIEEDQEFFIDALFVPTGELIFAKRVGPQERLDLDAISGLTLRDELPDADESFLSQLRVQLEKRNVSRFRFPKSAFALRIWWETGEQQP